MGTQTIDVIIEESPIGSNNETPQLSTIIEDRHQDTN